MSNKIENYIELINDLNSCEEFDDIIIKVDEYAKKKFSLLETGLFLFDPSDNIVKRRTFTNSLIFNILERLEEEAIIEWCFSKNELTFIPDIYNDLPHSNTLILIVPVKFKNKKIGIFIAITEKQVQDFSNIDLKEIESICKHSILRIDSIKSNSEIDSLNNRLRFLNSEILRTSEMASIGEIVSGISSEIDSPLKIINANLSLLSSQPMDTEIRIEIINQHINKINRIVDKLKSMSNEAENNIKAEKIDLNVLVNEVIMISESQLKKEGITLEIEKIETAAYSICNKNQLEHILLSIILHAKDMIIDNGNINISIFYSQKRNIISITDNGIGFSEDQLNSIFDAAFEMKVGPNKISGLYFQSQLAEKMNGRLEIVSELGKGTTYKLLLPSALK
jgi:signal transduction histidine kinase